MRNNEIVTKFKESQERLVTQGSDLALGSVSSMVESGAIELSPHYQRRERWSADRQSSLIESFLLNVPVPPVYLAEDDFGKYSIVDGKQRITSVTRFLTGKLKLSKLEELSELEGLRFSDLPSELQNTLQIRPYLRVITLLKQSHPDLKYEVFTRLNRGGESMTPQEIRNVAYRGPLNDLVYDLAEHTHFLNQQLKIRSEKAPAYQKMLDAEYVLRFLTLRNSWRTFSGNLQHEMNQFMHRNKSSDTDHLDLLRHEFSTAIQACEHLWGAHAFKRPLEQGWRDQFLAGMYDAEMIAVHTLADQLGEDVTTPITHNILDETKRLFAHPDFDEAARQATNTPSRLRLRVERVTNMLQNFVIH